MSVRAVKSSGRRKWIKGRKKIRMLRETGKEGIPRKVRERIRAVRRSGTTHECEGDKSLGRRKSREGKDKRMQML